MASGIRVSMNHAGARAILTSPGVTADLARRAEAVCREANSMASPDKMRNDAFSSEADSSGNRSHARVWASSPHGIRNDNKNDTLLRSLDAGR